MDILGLGGVAVDELVFVETFPGADAKTRVLRRERHCGGLTATALAAAARLGARCAYAGVLGWDYLSQFALECLQAAHVDVSLVQRTAKARPIYSLIVVSETEGTRNIFYDLNQVVGAGIRTPSPAAIYSCKVLVADDIGVPGMVRAARLARHAGRPVVGDFERDYHPLFPQLLPLADHLIVSLGFARKLTGLSQPEAAVRKLWQGDRQVAVVTCGERGCWYLGQGQAKPNHQPAFRVKVADTTGCGDVFHGAYAVGLVRGMELAERIRFAAAAAALKATKPGGQAGIPTLATVRQFLKP